MRFPVRPLGSLVAIVATMSVARAGERAAPANRDRQAKTYPSGWQIPENARDETSPLQPTPAVLKKGKSIYDSNCAKCHGPQGRGDGPDGDKDHPPADLTDASRAPRNPDGVLFYKVWNGRNDPKMPAFKSDLSKDEVWAVVEYAKSLRKQE